jgi:ABC-type glutathione transport system ATPase component
MSDPGRAPLLRIDDLHVTVAGRRSAQPVLRGVSLAVHAGEVHGLVG